MVRYVILGMALLLSGPAVAGTGIDSLDLWGEYGLNQAERLYLASADDRVAMGGGGGEAPAQASEYKPRWFTKNKVHQYLGIGSIAAAGLTLLAPKEDEPSAHHSLGEAAAGLGVAAVLTGLIFHWEDIQLSNGLRDPDNLHATLTTLGTLGYLGAVSDAPESGHGGLGAFGAISMAVGIKMTW